MSHENLLFTHNNSPKVCGTSIWSHENLMMRLCLFNNDPKVCRAYTHSRLIISLITVPELYLKQVKPSGSGQNTTDSSNTKIFCKATYGPAVMGLQVTALLFVLLINGIEVSLGQSCGTSQCSTAYDASCSADQSCALYDNCMTTQSVCNTLIGEPASG